MNYKLLHTNEEYELITLTEEHLKELFSWNIKETHFEQYTCRPLRSPQTFNDYSYKTLKSIREEKQNIYIMIKKGFEDKPLGKITLFDFNLRNHSSEFG